MTRVAIVQEAPVFLDKEKTIEKACRLVETAAAEGAQLVLFPETFIPCYPTWIWRLRPGSDIDICSESHARLLKNSVDLRSDDLVPLQDTAQKCSVIVVCGMNEVDPAGSGGTIYNAVAVIDETGRIVNHHRKLMPTNPERMSWGFGDASGLNVVHTKLGRLGGLICWENYMPLARYALYSQGVEVYVAPTYDSGEGSIGTMQHIAREGRCWVLCCGCAIQRTDIPDDFPDKSRLYDEDEDWINPGDSVVVAPGGEIVAGPLNNEKGILYCDIDVQKSALAKRTLDVAGHYSRSDIFSLAVNAKAQSSTVFEDS